MTSKWSGALLMVFLGCGCGDDSPGQNNNQNTVQIVCGNGLVEIGELCDDGENNSDSVPDACRTDCRLPYCGDQVVDQNETCDDGSSNSDFLAGACRHDCQLFHCGDGVADPGEDCDDANAAAGDGCSDQCLVEDQWQCSGTPSQCLCRDYHLGSDCLECRVFVNHDSVAAEPDGLTWETAFPSVQEGIDAGYDAGPGCEVWVAAGTYQIMQASLFNTVELRSGVGVYGGFVGDETERTQRDWEVNETTLDGEHPTDNAAIIHVVTAVDTVDATLDGFTVRNGFAQGPRSEDKLGAGMLTFGARMTIENCRFVNNYSTGDGGGLYSYGSELTIRTTVFVENWAKRDGAGLLAAWTHLSLDRCEIRANEQAITPSGSGGGLNSQGSVVNAVNTLFVDNTVPSFGGGIYSIYSTISLLHCTVANNSAGSGGAVYNGAYSDLDITSSLIVDPYVAVLSADATANYSVVSHASLESSGDGNIVATPLFANSGDYHLVANSAGIDRADGLAAPATDIEGSPRYNHTPNDIYDCANQSGCVSYADCGVYEFQP
jgi:cysteine-rich repeat protein